MWPLKKPAPKAEVRLVTDPNDPTIPPEVRAALAEAAAEMFSKVGKLRPPQKPPAEQIARMKDYFEAYGACRFDPGDIVMPRPDSHYHGEGWPHLVLEVLEPSGEYLRGPLFTIGQDADQSSNSGWGARLDMRVLHINDRGIVHAHWVESWGFEAYAEPAA